jgi:phage N-6-adenine-methyltransferase
LNNDLHFSSKSSEWGTPLKVYDHFDAEFKFTLDVCASKWNAKCANYFTKDSNGLQQHWRGRCWMNPPYGRTIGKWVYAAHTAVSLAKEAEVVVALLPARTDTRWFHDIILKHSYEVRFLKGRLTFETELDDIFGPSDPAPFPSMVVVFRKPKLRCPGHHGAYEYRQECDG